MQAIVSVYESIQFAPSLVREASMSRAKRLQERHHRIEFVKEARLVQGHPSTLTIVSVPVHMVCHPLFESKDVKEGSLQERAQQLAAIRILQDSVPNMFPGRESTPKKV